MMKKRILIVEDESDLTLFLKERLVSEGYEVHSASDGFEGVEKAKALRPDIILVDIMLPGLDGYSMAQRLKEDDLTTSIPLVVVTVKDTMRGLFERLGVNHYFTKPFNTEELLRAIKNILANNDGR